jgi:hypothetical protein
MSTLPFSSAAQRNRHAILEQLRLFMPKFGCVLEIGSGSGQHAVYFSEHLPKIQWQPTETVEHLKGLEERISVEGNCRIMPPLRLDVVHDAWPDKSYEGAFSANTAHIMSWKTVEYMFSGLALRMVPGGVFCLYGPFNIEHRYTAESNARFDLGLRAVDPNRGIRDMGDIENLANKHQMLLTHNVSMPANNFILVFVKCETS